MRITLYFSITQTLNESICCHKNNELQLLFEQKEKDKEPDHNVQNEPSEPIHVGFVGLLTGSNW